MDEYYFGFIFPPMRARDRPLFYFMDFSGVFKNWFCGTFDF